MRVTKTFQLVFFALIFLLFSFQEPKLKKRITDTNFKYEFYVADDDAEIASSDRTYYWFKGGAIHNSEYGVAGQLLNDDFNKFYLSNQLAEQGIFNNGLKVGLWKTWHSNGAIETTQYWANGRKRGMFHRYDGSGLLVEQGRYREDKKQGEWINFISKDTVTYKNGEVVANNVKGAKVKAFFKRLVTKIDRSNDPPKQKTTKNSNKVKTSPSNTKPKAEKKGFFQRLFSKKEKPNGKSK